VALWVMAGPQLWFQTVSHPLAAVSAMNAARLRPERRLRAEAVLAS